MAEFLETQYRINKVWSNSDVAFYYQLQVYVPYDKDHSCYVCYDSWKKARQNCHSNGPKWEDVSSGDDKWAKRTANHYGIKVS